MRNTHHNARDLRLPGAPRDENNEPRPQPDGKPSHINTNEGWFSGHSRPRIGLKVSRTHLLRHNQQSTYHRINGTHNYRGQKSIDQRFLRALPYSSSLPLPAAQGRKLETPPKQNGGVMQEIYSF